MTDHDDKLTRHYRELAREEPSAALDTAILAASRRAAAGPSASRRWAMPVSVAAILVLTVGVTLRMQQDQPGIETAMPESSQPLAPAAAPESAPQSPSPRPKAMEELRQAAPPPSVKAKDKLSAARRDPRNQAPEKIHPPPARDSLLKEEAQSVRAEPKPFADAPAKSAAPPPSEPAPAPQPATAPTAQGFATRMKREAAADSAGALQSAPLAATEQERELERIARLRIEGRHAEADKALEEFRRKFPDFRIPAAMWERVRAR